jgi:arylsulfatase A-like enzyme
VSPDGSGRRAAAGRGTPALAGKGIGMSSCARRYDPRLALTAMMLAAVLVAGCARGRHAPKFQPPPAKEKHASAAAQQLRAGARGANLIVIVFDAARADHFGAYGYRWPTTPNVDKLLAGSVVFDQAYCTASNTKASITSFLTSQFPDTHGTLTTHWMMNAEAGTLSESLRKAGYRTASFIANPVLAACFGFDRGFDDFDEVFRKADRHPLKPLDWGNVDASLVAEDVTAWLDEHQHERFFTYIHFLEPHGPYDATEEFRRRVMGPGRKEKLDDLPVRYDGRLAYVDSQVGRVLAKIDALGLQEKSVIIFMADHGEALGERGVTGHGKYGYVEMARVPLGIRLPEACGAAPARRSEIISLTDLMPTLADLLQFAPPETMQGRSRLRLLAGEEETEPAFAVTRGRGEDDTGGMEDITQVCYGFRTPGYTLALGDQGRQVELYEWETDPEENHDLASQERRVVKRMRRQFVAWAGTQRNRPVVLRGGKLPTPPSKAPEVDEKTRKRLRALGYLK